MLAHVWILFLHKAKIPQWVVDPWVPDSQNAYITSIALKHLDLEKGLNSRALREEEIEKALGSWSLEQTDYALRILSIP